MNKDLNEKDSFITISVNDRKGEEHYIKAPVDFSLSLMEILKIYQFPVEGTCGGMALCASCHVYVLSDHELHEASTDEEDMLDQAFFVENNSRLACQIKLNASLEGLKIKLALTDIP